MADGTARLDVTLRGELIEFNLVGSDGVTQPQIAAALREIANALDLNVAPITVPQGAH